jgi:uncharacterized protein YciI
VKEAEQALASKKQFLALAEQAGWAVFLMISTYTRPLAEVDAARAEHQAFMDELDAAGHVVGAGRQEPAVGGIVLLRADSADAAQALMDGDPYVLRGLAEYRAVTWQVSRGPLASL